MKLAISGATGYIGERLVSCAAAQGHTIVALTRRPPSWTDIEWVPFDLQDSEIPELPHELDVVIHLAATTQTPIFDEFIELQAAQRLITAASQCNCRIVFVSSQTARADAPTSYGRAKWSIEQAILAAGGVVIRPGQVYGGAERALYGALVAIARDHTLLPAFLPAPRIQPVHVDDLAEALLRVATAQEYGGTVLHIGAAEPVSFTKFLRNIVCLRLHKVCLFIPVPTFAVRVASRLLRPVLNARAGFDRLESLFELRPMATGEDLDRLGLTLRPLQHGLLRGGNAARRALIQEAYVLLTYILREKPGASLVKRYVRAVEQLRLPEALQLPHWALKHPSTLALLEGRAPSSAELHWRLHAAVVLAEASPYGASRFLRVAAPTGFIRAGFTLGLTMTRELAWRTAALILTPLLHRYGNRL